MGLTVEKFRAMLDEASDQDIVRFRTPEGRLYCGVRGVTQLRRIDVEDEAGEVTITIQEDDQCAKKKT